VRSPLSLKVLTTCGVALALAAGLGCSRDDRVRAEAHTFLALYRATDHRAPIAERERKIVQLEQLTLSEEAVRTARDQCVGAHRALIRAERENETAAGELDRAIAAQPDGGSLMAADTIRIRAGIERAEGSLSDARGRFEKCEAQARTLSLRFGG
jgi:type IV secretory pathway protease TraF